MRRKPEQTIVSVIEGEVKVTPLAVVANAASRIRVRAGTRIAVAASGEISSRSSVAAVLMSAWQQQPYRHANKLPFQVERTILAIKREFSSWGAPKIRDKLIRQLPMIKRKRHGEAASVSVDAKSISARFSQASAWAFAKSTSRSGSSASSTMI